MYQHMPLAGRALIAFPYVLLSNQNMSGCHTIKRTLLKGGVSMSAVGYGGFTTLGAILVLFILLVIVSRAWVPGI